MKLKLLKECKGEKLQEISIINPTFSPIAEQPVTPVAARFL